MNIINRISSILVLAGVGALAFGGYFQQCQKVNNYVDLGDCAGKNCTDQIPCKVMSFTTFTCSNFIDNTCNITSGDVKTMIGVYQCTATGMGCTCHYQDQTPSSTYPGGLYYQDNALCTNGVQPPQ